jgi:UPF0755 protein
MGRLATLAATVLIFIVAAGTAYFWAQQRYLEPGPLAEPVTLVIEKGSSVPAIAQLLADQGIIQARLDLIVAARLADRGRALKAGEYAFPAHLSLAGVFDLLESGRTVIHHLTIPEGLTSAQIVELVQAEPALGGDAGMLPAEGTLLPETYHFSLNDGRAALLARMSDAMRKQLAELWEKRSSNLPLTTPEQAVILASIVEKETGIASERPRIAGVFLNRLKIGMRLQSDPTIIYALTGGRGALDRTLSHADLTLDSPYNTYVVAGLPPTPIANPGRAALVAVLNPEPNDFLYFVADGSGGHAFAATLEAHNRNVTRWRALQKGG